MSADVASKIEDVWLESVVFETTIRPRTLLWLFAIAIALHGPIDVGLTTAAWLLESNPVVLELGVSRWIAIKIAALALASFVWFDAPRISPERYSIQAAGFLGVLIGLGLGLIIPNVWILLIEVVL